MKSYHLLVQQTVRLLGRQNKRVSIYNVYNQINLSSPLDPLLGEIDICAPGLFCTKFDSEQLSFEPFLLVMRILGSVEL